MAIDELMLNDPARDEMLILVDAFDREIGSATKLGAHVDGLLHRAFSAVLWREGENGPELLLAKRALTKYHSGGLWTNSCCSHPRVGEEVLEAGQRRVAEELGVEPIGLYELDSFIYRAVFDNGITEYEFDHVLLGRCEGEPVPDPAEASDVRWIGFDALSAEMLDAPEQFTVWAFTVFPMVMRELSK